MLFARLSKLLIVASLMVGAAAHARLSEGEAAIIGFGIAKMHEHHKQRQAEVIYMPQVPVGIPIPSNPIRPSYGPYVDYCGQYVNDSVALAYCKGQVDRMMEQRRADEQDAYRRGRAGQ